MAEVSFGEWLRRRRNAAGLTQEQLALKISCSTSALRKFESEERRPSAEVVEQLADIFSIPQEERKAFLRFTRGDWQAISGGDTEEMPWKVSTVSSEKAIKRATPRNNLPLQLTSFIGREKEQVEITNLIATNRLVTLLGAGGIGKTRLSLEVARGALNTFPDGLWFVELAPLSDPALVPQAIVNTLGLIEQANRSPQVILADFLKAKHALLIFDNCEHLVQAAAQLIETLLQACPQLHILATSRETLGVSGEWIHHVATLSIPDLQQSLTTASLTEYEAVQLFLDRAQTAVHNFKFTPENVPAIAQICHHLDGIPLALELAAARLRGLSVEQIAARLNDRFHLLTSGARTVLPRHQTLQALIDWSHDLLTEPERILLRRLSIFAGGWTLEAAEAVCVGNGLESNQILDLLLHLVDKSLVVAEIHDTESCYHMLETIRQYAREKSWVAGEGDTLRQRHLAYFVDLAERAEPNLRAFDMVMWLDRLEAELDNVRAALEYAFESDIEAELRLASALLWFWHIRGYKNEGIEWLERGLLAEVADRGNKSPTPSRAMICGKALNANGFLLSLNFEEDKAAIRLDESLMLFQELGPAGKQGMAYALLRLGGLYGERKHGRNMVEKGLAMFRELGDKFGIAECLMHLPFNWEEHLALRREIGDLDGIASALGNLSGLAFEQGENERAIALHEESLSIFRKLGNKWAISFGLCMFGEMLIWKGAYDRAYEIFEESLTFAQNVSDMFLKAYASYNLGTIAWLRGDSTGRSEMIAHSLVVFREVGNHPMVAGGLHALGDIALAQGEYEKASDCFEAEMTVGRERNVELGIILALYGLGRVALAKNDYEPAEKRFEEGMKLSREAGQRFTTSYALHSLGRVAQSRGNHTAAKALYREALDVRPHQTDHPFYWASLKSFATDYYPLAALAEMSTHENQMERAARLLGATESMHRLIQFQLTPIERAEHDQAIAAARAALGEEAFAAAWEEGKAMTLDESIAYALEED